MLPPRTDGRPSWRRAWRSADDDGNGAADDARRHISRIEPVGSLRDAVAIRARISNHLRRVLWFAGGAPLRHLAREHQANWKSGTVGLHLSPRAFRTAHRWRSARAGDAMTPGKFIAKWRAAELKERSAAQEHFIDLCRLPARSCDGRCPRPRRGRGRSGHTKEARIHWPERSSVRLYFAASCRPS